MFWALFECGWDMLWNAASFESLSSELKRYTFKIEEVYVHGRKAEWQSRHGAASEAAAEHFDHLRLVRPADNVPHSSFEAQ